MGGGGERRNGAGNNFYSPHYNHYHRVHTTGERNLNLNSPMQTYSNVSDRPLRRDRGGGGCARKQSGAAQQCTTNDGGGAGSLCPTRDI